MAKAFRMWTICYWTARQAREDLCNCVWVLGVPAPHRAETVESVATEDDTLF